MEQIIIDNKHEYDYKLDNTRHELHFSDNDEWTRPGDVGLEIFDDGDGLDVRTDDGSLVYLDYHTAEMLTILLKLINRKTTYEVVTKKERL
jgi:hypothetical protein